MDASLGPSPRLFPLRGLPAPPVDVTRQAEDFPSDRADRTSPKQRAEECVRPAEAPATTRDSCRRSATAGPESPATGVTGGPPGRSAGRYAVAEPGGADGGAGSGSRQGARRLPSPSLGRSRPGRTSPPSGLRFPRPGPSGARRSAGHRSRPTRPGTPSHRTGRARTRTSPEAAGRAGPYRDDDRPILRRQPARMNVPDQEGKIEFELGMDPSTGSPDPRAAVVRQHDQRDGELDHSDDPL